MNPAIIFATVGVLVSAFINALSVVASNGVRSELKGLRELMQEKHDAIDARVKVVEKFKDDFISSKLSKGAHA